MAFYVGQKVVCVDDSDQDCHPGDTPVKINSIYTIRGIIFDGTGVCLEEILNPLDRHYRAYRFRPVVEKSTDTGMAILRKILTDTKIKEKT